MRDKILQVDICSYIFSPRYCKFFFSNDSVYNAQFTRRWRSAVSIHVIHRSASSDVLATVVLSYLQVESDSKLCETIRHTKPTKPMTPYAKQIFQQVAAVL